MSCNAIQRVRVAPFLWKYFWECVRVGYHANRFEVAAGTAEQDAAIMKGVVMKFKLLYNQQLMCLFGCSVWHYF